MIDMHFVTITVHFKPHKGKIGNACFMSDGVKNPRREVEGMVKHWKKEGQYKGRKILSFTVDTFIQL